MVCFSPGRFGVQPLSDQCLFYITGNKRTPGSIAM